MATPQLIEVKKLIEFPVVKYTVEVIFSTDIIQSAKNRNVRFTDGTGPDNGGYDALHLYSVDTNKSGILLKFDPDVNAVIHESTHAIQHLVKHIGAGFDNEFVAYHIAYLCSQIIELSWQYRKPPARKNKNATK